MSHVLRIGRDRSRPETKGRHICFRYDSRTPEAAYDAIKNLNLDSFNYLDYTNRHLTSEELEGIKAFHNLGGQWYTVEDGYTTSDPRIATTMHQEYNDEGGWWWEIDKIWWKQNQ